MPAGTTMALISPGPVRAVTVMIDVIGVPELVMNAFSPSMTHSPVASSSTARVRVAPASLPPSGSVSPKAPRARPAHRSGSQRWRCSSVPKWKIGLAPEADAGLERDGHRLVDPAELLDGDAQRGEVGAASRRTPRGTAGRTARARPWRARCRPGRCGRGPTPRRGARSRARRSRGRPCGTPPARRLRSKSTARDRRLGPCMPSPRRRRRPPAAPGCATSPPTSPRSTATGSGRSCCPTTATPVCARFDRVRPARPWPGPPWRGPARERVDVEPRPRRATAKGVEAIREAIAAGDVYQVNLCRRAVGARSRRTPTSPRSAPRSPRATPRRTRPSCALPRHGVHVASASPERFLRRDGARSSSRSPIKGTAATADGFLAKDRAENVMIVDLVRNDLGRVCEYGSVDGARRCARSRRTPGSFHLVSTVPGRLRAGVGWPELIDATFPPGSVTGAPKLAAIEVIDAARARAARGRTAARSAGSTPTAARATSTSPSARSGSPTASCTSAPAAASRGTRPPTGEWEETELKARTLHRPGLSADGRRPREGVDRRRAGRRGATRACRRSTTGCSPATACSRRSRSTTAGPFAVRRHLERLARSAGGPRARRCPTRRCCAARSTRSCAANGLGDGRLRITVTGGPSPLGSERGAAPADRHRGRRARSAPWPAAADVAVVPWPRNERGALAGLKTTSYGENVVALAYATRAGRDRGHLRQPGRQPVRGHRHQRVRRRRRPARHAAALVRLPRRRHPRPRPRGHRRVEDDLPLAALAERRRGVPHLDDARGAADPRRRRPRPARVAPGPLHRTDGGLRRASPRLVGRASIDP